MKLQNPAQAVIWQTIQAYKLEAINPDYNFTDEQKQELLKLANIAQQYHASISGTGLGKMYNALKSFDKLFVEYGGDIDQLYADVDEITSTISSNIRKAADVITNTPGTLKRLVKAKFRRG